MKTLEIIQQLTFLNYIYSIEFQWNILYLNLQPFNKFVNHQLIIVKKRVHKNLISFNYDCGEKKMKREVSVGTKGISQNHLLSFDDNKVLKLSIGYAKHLFKCTGS